MFPNTGESSVSCLTGLWLDVAVDGCKSRREVASGSPTYPGSGVCSGCVVGSGAGSSGNFDDPCKAMACDTCRDAAKKSRDDLPGRGRFTGNGVLYTALENTGRWVSSRGSAVSSDSSRRLTFFFPLRDPLASWLTAGSPGISSSE